MGTFGPVTGINELNAVCAYGTYVVRKCADDRLYLRFVRPVARRDLRLPLDPSPYEVRCMSLHWCTSLYALLRYKVQ